MPNAEMTENIIKSGDQPMTPAQSTYLKSLCTKAGVEFDGSLSKASASRRIDELNAKLRS